MWPIRVDRQLARYGCSSTPQNTPWVEQPPCIIAIWCIAVGSMGDSAPRVSVKITSAMLTINAMLRVTDCDANAQALILAKDTVLFAIEYDALTVSINASCH